MGSAQPYPIRDVRTGCGVCRRGAAVAVGTGEGAPAVVGGVIRVPTRVEEWGRHRHTPSGRRVPGAERADGVRRWLSARGKGFRRW